MKVERLKVYIFLNTGVSSNFPKIYVLKKGKLEIS